MLSSHLLTHYRQISQRPFTVVDVETTGRYPNRDRVIELSVLHATLADGVQQQRTELVNPQTRIPSNIVQFTGITQTMVDAAAPAAEVFPTYWSWLTVGLLTAHNLEFDYPFLQAEYDRLDTAYTRSEADQLCTVQFSRLMLPDLPSRSLPKLVKHFQFNVGRSHRAAADTLACWLLLERLLTEVLNEADEILLARFAKQWLPLKYAAKVLGCSPATGQTRLVAAGVPARFVGRGKTGTWMYRRGDVERVFHEQSEETQPTCL
jgi:DNA polymerase III subunit epsilon